MCTNDVRESDEQIQALTYQKYSVENKLTLPELPQLQGVEDNGAARSLCATGDRSKTGLVELNELS